MGDGFGLKSRSQFRTTSARAVNDNVKSSRQERSEIRFQDTIESARNIVDRQSVLERDVAAKIDLDHGAVAISIAQCLRQRPVNLLDRGRCRILLSAE